MIDFQFDAAQVEQMALNLAATEDQARKALRTTLNKMAAWVRTRSIKGLSQTLQMQQKTIRRRLKAVKFRDTPDGGVAKVWYGENAVGMIYLGAKQDSAGVTASGGRSVKGAFISKTKTGGAKQVFKRAGSARLPLVKQEAAIKKPTDKYLESGVVGSAAFEVQFWKTFEHELKWRTQ